MSVYMTEEEQLESIKKLWKRYGNLITGVLSLILLAVAGYRYLYWHQEKLTQQASIAYEHMMAALSNHNIKSVRSYANELVTEHNGSVYADAAHLTLAKVYVSKNKLDRAFSELQQVALTSKVLPLQQIAKIRIARIYAAEKAYTKALNELSSIDDTNYVSVVNELRGDIYGATGQYQEAMDSYKLALDEAKNSGIGSVFLEMKTNELANKSHSMKSEDKIIKSV